MKASEITIQCLISYLRLDDSVIADETSFLQILKDTAITFISNYTGLSKAELDLHEDFVIVIYILVQDMYDNRSLYIDKTNLNNVVETILGMHCINLL